MKTHLGWKHSRKNDFIELQLFVCCASGFVTLLWSCSEWMWSHLGIGMREIALFLLKVMHKDWSEEPMLRSPQGDSHTDIRKKNYILQICQTRQMVDFDCSFDQWPHLLTGVQTKIETDNEKRKQVISNPVKSGQYVTLVSDTVPVYLILLSVQNSISWYVIIVILWGMN